LFLFLFLFLFSRCIGGCAGCIENAWFVVWSVNGIVFLVG